MTARPRRPYISNGHAGLENVLVSKGTLKVGPTDCAVVLEAGDFVSFAADGPHVYSCESAGPVRAMLAMRHPAGSIAGPANDSVILALTDQQSPDLTE
ncbi:cupin domain-containing protein [Solicola gregarius]|uniref:cupin domain-containing protein n=1 Tax=Solicola gregarius TaxID=2908642 RepID=UPI0038CD2C89